MTVDNELHEGPPQAMRRGDSLAPPVHVDETDDHLIRARVTFGPLYRFDIFGQGAVHGGAIPLLFDELFGQLANAAAGGPARTAFLHVDYRNVTPVGRELRVEVRVTRTEGRKLFLNGTLHDGDVLCAELESLFVVLRPGQP